MKPDVQRIFTKLAKEKVELGAVQDFEKAFDKANDSGLKISEALIDAMSKAEQKYKQNLSDWDRALQIGEKLTKSYKDLGVDIPSKVKNQIASCKSEKKEEQGFISAINSFYSKF